MEHLSALVTPEARQKKEVQEEAPKNEKFEDKFNQLRQHRRSGFISAELSSQGAAGPRASWLLCRELKCARIPWQGW